VWVAVFSEHWDDRDFVYIAGAVVLAWTAWRTLRRLVLLAR
jgi:threonine/homoserine/homoserine lactone efflux protein